MIKDAKQRKWFLRFRHYRQGWHWQARWPSWRRSEHGQDCGDQFFATRALAEADARRSIASCDAIAEGAEYLRRLQMRGGASCQLTPGDHEAIDRAGRV